MRRLLALALAGLAATATARPAPAAPERPTRAMLRRVLEQHARSAVEVRSARRRGPGVIVGEAGEVLTSVQHVELDSARVRWGGHTLTASVVMANARLGVALVALAGPHPYPAVPVRLAAREELAGWAVGIVRGAGGRPRPAVGRLHPAPRAPWVEVDLPLPPGSPVYDGQGRLVAVVVRRQGASRARALPLAAVKLQLAASERP